LAVDKVALRPGSQATVANYTRYDKGLNGFAPLTWPERNFSIPLCQARQDFDDAGSLIS
jgi:hypothetical protein